MGSLNLIGDSSPVEIEFRGTLSPEYVDEMIDQTGVRPPTEFEITFKLDEVESQDHRRRLRLARARYQEVTPYPELRRPAEDPGEFLEAIEPWLDQAERDKAEQEARESLEAEEADAAMSLFREEMKRWVSEHGSERLRLATEGNYRTNTSYALERSKLEMPGFWLDSAEDCEWGERADPSEEALLLEKSARGKLEDTDLSLKIRIVWLTETPRALNHKMEEEGLEFEPQEALIVEQYLGRYLLVMPLEVELRRDPEEAY
jgi:hypothetical protein